MKWEVVGHAGSSGANGDPFPGEGEGAHAGGAAGVGHVFPPPAGSWGQWFRHVTGAVAAVALPLFLLPFFFLLSPSGCSAVLPQIGALLESSCPWQPDCFAREAVPAWALHGDDYSFTYMTFWGTESPPCCMLFPVAPTTTLDRWSGLLPVVLCRAGCHLALETYSGPTRGKDRTKTRKIRLKWHSKCQEITLLIPAFLAEGVYRLCSIRKGIVRRISGMKLGFKPLN